MLNTAKSIDKTINKQMHRIIIYFAGLSIILITAALLFEVISRYLFGISHGQIGENSQILYIWVVFLMMGIIYQEQGHISRNFIPEILLKRNFKRACLLVEMLNDVATILFGLMFLYFGFFDVHDVKGSGAMSFLPGVPPDWIIHLSLPVGCVILIYYAVKKLINKATLLI